MNNNNNNGTYVAVRFSEDTANRLRNYALERVIPNCLPMDEYHSTVIYSKNQVKNVSPNRVLDPPWIGIPIQFDLFDNTEDGVVTKCLVLKISCEKLEARHNHLVKYEGATHDFPSYEAHITISYDVGDFDIARLDIISLGLSEINMVCEFSEDLEDDGRK